MGIIFILPAFILISIFFLWPITETIRLSFYEKSLLHPETTFVGIENYIKLFTGPYADDLLNAFMNNLVWTFGCISLEILLGLGLSLLLYQEFKFRSFIRGFLLFPYMIPTIIAALMWRFMFNDMFGVLNKVLMAVGLISQPIIWLGSPQWAMLSIIITATWRYYPFVIIALLARMQTIPTDLYDASFVDGANAWQRFRHITYPSIKSVLIITLLLRSIWTFNKLTEILILTGGGPMDATETLPVLTYNMIFGDFSIGTAATNAVFIFFILIVMSRSYLSLYSRAEEEMG
jgi:ABC-type sugar transport system permease subunit